MKNHKFPLNNDRAQIRKSWDQPKGNLSCLNVDAKRQGKKVSGGSRQKRKYNKPVFENWRSEYRNEPLSTESSDKLK